MTAQEFIKKHGWEKAKLYANGWITFNSGRVENDVINKDLKQLVDAWDLVQKFGGLTKCQFIIVDPLIMWDTSDIKQAIELVESVNENQD